MDELKERTQTAEWEGIWEQPQDIPADQNTVLKTARKHFSRLGLCFLVGGVAIQAVQYALLLLIRRFKPEWLRNMNFSIIFSLVVIYMISMPLLIALVKRVPTEKVEKHHMKPGQFVIAAIMCFAIMFASNIIGNIITFIIGILKGGLVQNPIQGVVTSADTVLLFAYSVICAPIMEEYVFRKLIVDRTVRYGQGVAVVLSGLMFGLFHGNLNQFAYAFTLGMFLAFVYVKTGKLKITIAYHMMINFVGGIVSTKLLELLSPIMNMTDGNAEVQYFVDNPWILIIYLIYLVLVFGVMIAGIVLLIVALARKRFTLEPGQVVIPRGRRFVTVILNVGMILYCIFWMGMIIGQLFDLV